jgi:hypothetical protein
MGDQNSAFVQHLPRAFLRVAANRVKHYLHTSDDVVKAGLSVVNRFVSSKLAQKSLIFRRSSPNNLRAFPFSELHSEASHPSGRAVNQNLLAGSQLRLFEQRLPSRECCQRDCGGAYMVNRFRLKRRFCVRIRASPGRGRDRGTCPRPKKA